MVVYKRTDWIDQHQSIPDWRKEREREDVIDGEEEAEEEEKRIRRRCRRIKGREREREG